MTRFRSGRLSHQHIGISSFTEDKLVLGVTGHANISGILTVAQQLDAPNIVVTGTGSSITVDDINARNLIVSGISTFLGQIGAGDTLGSPGQYLKCTEDGVTWASFGGVRDEETHIATNGQTVFTGIEYNPFFTDIYVNGVKLTDVEYSAPGGNTFTLNSGCFAGDIVELISYNTDSLTNGQAGGSTLGVSTTGTSLFNNILSVGVITSTKFYGDGSNLTGINTTSTYAQISGISTLSEGLTGSPNIVVGVATATKYFGDGSSLSGIISGIEFQDEATTVGTAGTVNFVGNGVTATYSGGTATISIGDYADTSGIATVAVNAQGLIGSPSITVDNIIANNVSVAQTLTYEDVTNIDSVGLVTARSGVRVLSGGINVVGIVTASSFQGNLTGNVNGNATTATNALGISGSPNVALGGVTAAGIQVSGLCTANTFVGNVVGSVQGGNWNGYDVSASNNISAASSITGSVFYGDGSQLSGIVTTDDTAPSDPSDGALWWKSDEGVLKIYYQDADSSQWVDASPGGGGGGGSISASDVINDLTPQLGGNLDLNTKDIQGTGNISISGNGTFGGGLTASANAAVGSLNVTGVSTFGSHVTIADDSKITVGDNGNSYLEIYHQTSDNNTYIQQASTASNSNLYISATDNLYLRNKVNEPVLIGIEDGATEIYFDGTKKIETTESGAVVSGAVTATYYYGNGSALTDIYAAPPAGINTEGFSGFTNVYCSGTLEVDKQSILDDVIVSAAATFQGALSANTGPVTLNNTTANGNTDVTGIATFRNDVTLIGSGGNDVKWNTSLNRMDFPVGTKLTFGNAADFQIYNDGDSKAEGNISFLNNVSVEGDSNVTGTSTLVGKITASAINNVIPFYYDSTSQFPSASTYHGAFAHAHDTGRAYFAHAGWKELVNKESNGTVGTGTETYNIGSLTATGIDLNGDIDVDGHAEFDNARIVGVLTATTVSSTNVSASSSITADSGFYGNVDVNGNNIEVGDCTTAGTDNTIKVGTSGLEIHHRPTAYATYIQNKNKDTNLWITGQNTSGVWGNIFIRPYLNAFSGVACWWGGATELYYGNTGSKKLETTSGGVTITGTLSKSGGSFKIPHPVAGLSTTKHLVHSFLEGPQMDLIYRGKIDLVGGTATVNIDTKAGMTEGTFVLLNRDIQCFTSNETGWTAVKGSVSGNILTITAQDNTCTDTISWMVVGERQDDTVKSLDMTDSEGNLIVEPDQPAPDTKHADIQAQL